MKLLLATANPHKLREISELLAHQVVDIVSLASYPDLTLPAETGTTMAENAAIKARYCAAATGLPALADDSGIEVDTLGGAPGVHSARWLAGSDADRTAALLQRVGATGDTARAACYRCVICLAQPDGQVTLSEAVCEGRIAEEGRGANGFGYDPIFEITDATGTAPGWIGRTMAEVPPAVKAQVSHRARALAAATPHLLQWCMQERAPQGG